MGNSVVIQNTGTDTVTIKQLQELVFSSLLQVEKGQQWFNFNRKLCIWIHLCWCKYSQLHRWFCEMTLLKVALVMTFNLATMETTLLLVAFLLTNQFG